MHGQWLGGVSALARAGILLVALAPLAAAGEAGPYVRARDVDLVRYLPGPPAAGTAADAADLAAVRAAQASRTPAAGAAARADQEVSIFRFSDVLGARFAAPALPHTAALGHAACRDAAAIVGAAKRHWQRPRPYVAHADIEPVAAVSSDGSYPSGHATCGYLWAILLADMVPERRGELFARGIAYGDNRVIGGVHYPSDVAAARIGAAVVAAALYANPDFLADLARARAELRTALDLEARPEDGRGLDRAAPAGG